MSNEYEHEPVPQSARRSLFSVAAVWAGFPMVMIGAFVGGQVVSGLGFARGMLVIVLGNLVLAAYVAFLSALAAKEGKTFGLSAKRLFGHSGAKLVSILLSGLVVGWFAVQTGLAGRGVTELTGLPAAPAIIVIGVIFMLMTLAGMRMLKPLSIVSILLFACVAVISMVTNFTHASWGQVIHFQGSSTNMLSLGAGLTMAISSFIDSGTLTADFTRWSKTPRQAVLASLCAFPIGNMIPMLLGGIVAASGTATDGDFSHLLGQWGPLMGSFGALFFVINCSSVAVHGLYNATAGWSALLPLNFRPMTLMLGLIGILLATAGITEWLTNWLALLGIVVPGIGGAIIGWMVSGHSEAAPRRLLLAWLISILCGSCANLWWPGASVALVSIVSALAVSWISLKVGQNAVRWEHA
ncbi:purine-cytosine permease family protein [Carnimonas nigrificans]|uniref:purine-cytosine permease family protein n=1 Tax=Carnimonas nigrificans TaxID=64323 RepID=UPI000471BCFE|nr:cytosine permease [Carnimonas nigrificans]